MSNILLAKPKLPDGHIDVSVGEPYVVRDVLFKVFDLSLYELPKVEHMWEYPEPNGYHKLVQLLEDKHQAPVIITNGAKQALGATFYALHQMNKKYLGMRTPYWALIPPLAKMHGLSCLSQGYEAYLSLAPNNPDNFLPDLKLEAEEHKAKGIPFIHDAAYYTRTYVSSNVKLNSFGDVQIFSISKMFGLSGLRLGYAVCPNKEFYKLIMQYMEAMTVGASIVSQIFLFDLMNRMQGYPTLTDSFENQSFMALEESKKIMTQVSPEVLVVPSDLEKTSGMFGWFKVGPKFDPQRAKVNFIDGSLFGVPGMVRMNLAWNAKQMQEIVTRLNSVL